MSLTDQVPLELKDLAENARKLGVEIYGDFMREINGERTLSESERMTVWYSTNRIAEVALLSIGASEDQRKVLKIAGDLARSNLLDIAAIKAMGAERAFQKAVQRAVFGFLNLVLGALLPPPLAE
jgi:hypothetical protein